LITDLIEILFSLWKISDKPTGNQQPIENPGRIMAPPKSEKKKAKRKAKLKQAKTRKSLSVQRGQRRFLLD